MTDTTGWWLMGSRGCLLEAPHLNLGSIKQSVSVLFEIQNLIYGPSVVPTTCGECGVVCGEFGVWCVECRDYTAGMRA